MIDRIRQLEEQYLSACIVRSRQWMSRQDAPPAYRPGVEKAYLEALKAERDCLAELRAASAESVQVFEEVA